MSMGRRSGIALALGVAVGSFCWAMLSVLGLSALLASYAAALSVVKVVIQGALGALFGFAGLKLVSSRT
jgi:threonine/homoserine/homoserine lactone efflux protein